jgi:recombination protein RecA
MDDLLVKAMVIGDGCLCNGREAQGYRNYRFTCLHSIKQKEYLLWKSRLLAEAGIKTWYSEFWSTTNPHTGKKALMCRIESGVSSHFTDLHGLMYPKKNGFKPGVLEDLEVKHLAIIFMDDGTKDVLRKGGRTKGGVRVVYECEPYIHAFRLCLQSHGRDGAQQFSNWLSAKFGVYSRVHSQCGSAVLDIQRNEAKERFRELIAPHVHPSMAYKLEGSLHFHAIHRERLSERAPTVG